MQDAGIDRAATYYACNVEYPNALNAIMLFFQHTIFDLKDTQTLPPSTAKLINNLQKVKA